jgi:hypothetical protein
VVINLAVEDRPDAARRAAPHRVVARRGEIDDGEPSVAEAQPPAVEQLRARVVRPAVRHPVAHPFDERQFDPSLARTVLPDTADAAHERSC